MRPRILLLPELFPSDQKPDFGVFMNDYLRILNEIGDVIVFNSNPWYRGAFEQRHPAQYYDLHLFEKKWPSPWNALAYRYWELQSYRFGKRLPKPDVVYLHGAVLRGNWAVKLATHWQVPLVITEHTGPWSKIAGRPILLHKARMAMEAADVVMPVSTHLASEIARSSIAPIKVTVAGNPVDTDKFSLRASPLGKARNILFIGRLDEFKGGLRTLEAFVMAAVRLPGYTLTIAGDGEESVAIQQQIDHDGLAGRVRFMRGFFDRNVMRELLHGASFLVYPSRFESFGLVGAEAMATGLPVIITGQTGPVDYFATYCGMQVNPDDVEGISQAMIRMAERIDTFDPAAIRAHIHNKYGIHAFANQLSEVFKEIGISG